VSIARGIGRSERVAIYEIADDQLPAGSTLGGPRVTATIKATGAIEKVFSPDSGLTLFGTVMLRHYDPQTGMALDQEGRGSFVIHPEHQEHHYTLTGGIGVIEDIFVLSGEPEPDGKVDPPGVYQTVTLTNQGPEERHISTYSFAILRGDTEQDIEATYDRKLNAIVAWNRRQPDQVRIFGTFQKPAGFETTTSYAQSVSESSPGPLSCRTSACGDVLGVLCHTHHLAPREHVTFSYLLSFGQGREEARSNYRSCPDAVEALQRTKAHYHEALSRAVVLTPDPVVNRGVLWAKANMLRVMTRAPTGWCFVNDPTRSNNSVARDTAWFVFGADYFLPTFSRDALLAYVGNQEESGMMVEYYDIRTGETEDYNLNINDDTPLVVLAIWHYYNTTGDIDFLRKAYPAALRAARYILSQRNDQGLVWCMADGVSDWGICSWRNVIPNYRLSGAVTEVNSECYAALETVSSMARVLGKHEESAELADAAGALYTAINTHLKNPDNGLYYLNIDLDGQPRSDVTSDLVFPVIFNVADGETATAIVSRLNSNDFWTSAGMRTTPRDSPMYTPSLAWGLMGGVWVGVSYWYASAAAPYAATAMARALHDGFEVYSRDPLRHNTVPGQFSEWLHGETLANQGMMLSPWFPPRYLWAAVEGMAGFETSDGTVRIEPHLAAEWKWLGVQNLQYRGQSLTWIVVRCPDLNVYTNFPSTRGTPAANFQNDITEHVTSTGDMVCAIGLGRDQNLLLFVGNTEDRTTTTAIGVRDGVSGTYSLRLYNSMLGRWTETGDRIDAETLNRGMPVKLERRGFCLLDFHQET
jgi:hypothetical protein